MTFSSKTCNNKTNRSSLHPDRSMQIIPKSLPHSSLNMSAPCRNYPSLSRATLFLATPSATPPPRNQFHSVIPSCGGSEGNTTGESWCQEWGAVRGRFVNRIQNNPVRNSHTPKLWKKWFNYPAPPRKAGANHSSAVKNSTLLATPPVHLFNNEPNRWSFFRVFISSCIKNNRWKIAFLAHPSAVCYF